ncbi:biopolymer transporter ExbD [Sedimentisphaera salicampi]|uniref:Biopolymer transport protein ExbD/TolR n=1 Tax=Sedimentisphaera salicampi TaxID=1941349 RepID=A0A1W6LP32_9BACT|nr:biopolymer transporter ExbD [Sedimentisphaera salicampi]ARN57521.1 Biopolymer transport protein ExbD/TolR [Sedimentisphaera salicampi]OXU14383.1 Biopolymer transport protein ExbD/TolR [Sedimentisphaera salicampi]
MLLEKLRNAAGYLEFNITAIIDIIFILIIFLLFLGQFIASENYPVEVPEQMHKSVADEGAKPGEVVLNVMREDDGTIMCIFQDSKLALEPGRGTVLELETMINRGIELLHGEALINLRMDRGLVFSEYRPVITAIANSNASEMIISGLQEKKDRSSAVGNNSPQTDQAGE